MLETLSSWLSYSLLGNTLQTYLSAILIFLGTLLILRIFKFIIIRRLKKVSQVTKTNFDDHLIKVISEVSWWFYVVMAIYIALQFITLPAYISSAAECIVLIVLLYYGVRILQKLIDYGTRHFIENKQTSGKPIDTGIIYLLNKLIHVILWVIAIIWVLSNLGYNVSTLIAGLGIGGIAVALALQNVLGDLFASISLYFDKPFEIGDFIVIDDDAGIVEKIGIKTTRIKTLQGEELIILNSKINSSRIRNFKKMEKRRIVFRVGVAYETKTDLLQKIPSMITGVLEKMKEVEVDRVHFSQFGDSSLIFEIVYYVQNADYNKYMDLQQEMNLAIHERFQKEQIIIAYPTQTIYLKN